MSRRIALEIQNMQLAGVQPDFLNFVRAKRLLHEALLDHYITPEQGIMTPVELGNDENVVIRYKSIPYDIPISVTMAVRQDVYSFHIDVCFESF